MERHMTEFEHGIKDLVALTRKTGTLRQRR